MRVLTNPLVRAGSLRKFLKFSNPMNSESNKVQRVRLK
jgi:hypothetical protein